MAKLTLKQARDNLYMAAVPNLTGETNGIPNVEVFNTYLNWAMERLINSGQWEGMVVPVLFAVPENHVHITLPPRFASVLAMRYKWNNAGYGDRHSPVQILNKWYAYTSYGAYCWNWNAWGLYGFVAWNSYARDEGDGFVTFRTIPYERYRLKFTLENAEDDGMVVLVKGYNGDNGERIFTPSSSYAYEGVEIPVSYPYTVTSQVFSKDLYFVGKNPSQGYLYLDAVDEVTGEETRVGMYWPSEGNASYHRYRVGCLDNQKVSAIECLCKLRYMPVISDQDEVWPGNLGALQVMIEGIKYQTSNDNGRYQAAFTEALRLLNDEARAVRGGANMTLNINPNAFQMQNLYPGR